MDEVVMKATAIGWLVLVMAAAVPPSASAQDDDEEESAEDEGDSETEEGSEDGEEDEEGEDDEEASEDEEGDGEADDEEGDDAAPSATRSWYFGPIVRYTILPAFMLKLGLAEAPTVANATIGVVANHRNPDGASFELGLAYTGLGFDGPMRANGDPPEDTEWVESDLWMLHATASIYWTAGIIDKLSFEYGIGIDFGLLLGELKRTEAYPSGSGYARCPGVIQVPNINSDYCAAPSVPYDEEGEHYGVVQEDLTPIGGNLMIPHLALRYEPIPELAVKLEGALGFPMFWIGLSAAYGPEL
jgi:hypothetical protein